MARIEVPMPQMGESIAEGTVSVWLKKVGDPVERDEPIMEISTDKVDAEIPSPAAGVLAQIVVKEGETVEVGTTVAFIETDASVPTVVESSGPPPEEPNGRSNDKDPQHSPDGAGTTTTTRGFPVHSSAATGRALSGPTTDPSRPETAEERLRRRSTPLVRRIAAEHGVSVEEVKGTGRSGRVTKEDVLRFVMAGGAGGDRQASASGGFHTHVHHPTVEVRPGDRTEPMSRMTTLIAEHMVLSRRISAHVHTFLEVDYSWIDRSRAENARSWEQRGVKVTYTAFIARAVARALREFPLINASVSGNQIIYRGEVNIGIAVALERGLIVPVVRQADTLSLVELARSIADLAERARTKRLSPEEVQGGTFTITNPGGFGALLGFPIINQPQVAIMAVGGIEKRPVVITDELGHDAIVVRKRGLMSLGFDHRIVNGADADRFLFRVKKILEAAPEPD